jgi:hypothetical protein
MRLALATLLWSLPALALAQAVAPDAAASAPYVDRVIEGLATDTDVQAAPYDASGRPRWWRIESRWGQETASFGGRLGTLGLALQGGYDTLNHGAWSIDAQTRRARRSDVLVPPLNDTTDSVLTVRQRGFPLGGGWWMNNDFGAIGLAAAPLTRAPARVSLPLVRVQGVSGEWVQAREGWTAALSTGRPAIVDGLFTNEITVQPGRITQTALQWNLQSAGAATRSNTQVAAQVARGKELRWGPQERLVDANSLWLGSRWAGGGSAQANAQLQFITSSVDSRNTAALPGAVPQGTSQGAWLDASWRASAFTHGAGAYRLGAGLNWAGLPMAADAAGLYWRTQWQSRVWSVDGGMDLLRSGASTNKDTGFFSTLNLRHRVQRNLNWTLATALRRLDSLAYNLAGELQWTHGGGQTVGRIELDGDRGTADAPSQHGTRLIANHDWALANGWAWATGLTLGQVSGSGAPADRRVIALASSLDAPITSALSLRGSGNVERLGGQQRSGLQAALDWQLTPGWNLETRINIDRGRLQRVRSLDPLTPPPPPPADELSARSVFVVLRYAGSAGSSTAPLGGRSEEGGGAISGMVYLDANRNGRQDPGERGAAGVTVTLEGRYTAVTDAQGRFEFAWVAPGLRAVTVLNETLPLPWSAPDEGRTVVDVRLRAQHAISIAVTSQ